MLGLYSVFFPCKRCSQFKGFVDLYSENSLGYIQKNKP
jgi:hypothetical protein